MADEVGTAKREDQYQLKAPHTCKIVYSYMPEALEKDAVNIATVAVDQFKQLKDIAYHIKHELDRKYPGTGKATEGTYHCVVGKSFASAISHATREFLHVKIDIYHVIIWKSKDSLFHANE